MQGSRLVKFFRSGENIRIANAPGRFAPTERHLPLGIASKNVVENNPKKEGVKGCSPWAASPFGGERG
jgi:hypothetical protein